MLIRHSSYYLLARGLPGLLSFAALISYTRLLSPTEFGQFSLVVTGIGLAQVIGFQWLQLVLARFLPAQQETPGIVLQSILALFIISAGFTSSIGVVLLFYFPTSYLQQLIIIAIPLTVAQAWLQINLTLAATQLAPTRYGLLLGAKSLIAVIIGSLLAWIGMGAQGPLVGLLLGSLLTFLLFGTRSWRGVRPRLSQAKALREYSAYGIPLVATFALGWVITSSDRLIIAWLINEAATGTYAAGYDLAQQSLGLLLAIVNTAAYPLVMRQLESEGVQAASIQLKKNGELITALALTGAAGLIALSPAIVHVIFGESFRAGAEKVLPWIALSAAISGIKAFYFDVSLQITKQSKGLAIIGIITALINVALNFILIPHYGIIGAAWATLTAFSVSIIITSRLGERSFPMPAFTPILLRSLTLASFVYAGVTVISSISLSPIFILISGIPVGLSIGVLGAIALDVAGARRGVNKYIQK